jgi:Response regulator containing a CheY-like receiver domain and an HTH DNA-binding domain
MFSSKVTEEHKHKVSVLLVDNFARWQNSLVEVLSSMDYRVEVAGSYEQAKNLLEKKTFDVAVVEPRFDLDDPSTLDGMRLVTLICNTQQSTKVIILTGFATHELVREAFKYNILDLVDKREGTMHIVTTIEKALSTPSPTRNFPPLTIPEQEILELVVNGKTDHEIAKELNRADDTIKKHVGNILAKLDTGSRSQIAVLAERYHLTVINNDTRSSSDTSINHPSLPKTSNSENIEQPPFSDHQPKEIGNEKRLVDISKNPKVKEKKNSLSSPRRKAHANNENISEVVNDVIPRSRIEVHKSKHSNQFRYLLQTAIDLYAKTQKRNFADILAEMDDQLGYGRNSHTIQSWLNESVIPSSAEVEYFAKKIIAATNLDFEWTQKLFDAAGYEVPFNLTDSKSINGSGTIVGRDVHAISAGRDIISTINTFHIFFDQPAEIFVSYARTDVELVRGIYETLLSKNHRLWMDVYSIKGGENWFRAITKAINECEIFLAVLSNNSVSRRGVIQKELKKALDKWEGMLPDDIYIIPIRIDDCPIPDLLKHIQVLDWDNGKGESKLLEAIRVGLARRKADG